MSATGRPRHLHPRCWSAASPAAAWATPRPARPTPVAAPEPSHPGHRPPRTQPRGAPGLQLVVQPPGGKTLVNFDTLFRTEAEPFTRTVRLLGHRVDLEITPASFSWSHGDGTRQVTSDPGRAFQRGWR